TEHSGDESDRQSHTEDQKNIDGQIGNGEIDLHAGGPASLRVNSEVRSEASRHAHRGNSDPFGIGSIARMSTQNVTTHQAALFNATLTKGHPWQGPEMQEPA